MPLTAAVRPALARPVVSRETEPAVAAPRSAWWSPSAWATFAASFLTAFTIPLVGEMPVGELVLIVVALWAGACLLFNGALPGPLFRRPFLGLALAAQVVAFVAYVGSDLYRHSSPHDMARGWGRMGFLAIDIVAVAYLFGCARRNFVLFIVGQELGAVVSALLYGAMFDDLWKFGVGAPLTALVFLLVPLAGGILTALGAFAIGAAHFALDYRSYGGLCLLVGVGTLLQLVRPQFRLWLAPLALLAVGAVVFELTGATAGTTRTSRSDIERTAMVQAAVEAVAESPLVGHGSWFSNTDVYDNFVLIRDHMAREAHVGGFATLNKDSRDMALHSQILVAVAEGGVFGGVFFFVFGAGLLRALYDLVLVQPWHRLAALCTLTLLSALWNLLFSPFSGAHRVAIALALGLILLLQDQSANPGEPNPREQ